MHPRKNGMIRHVKSLSLLAVLLNACGEGSGISKPVAVCTTSAVAVSPPMQSIFVAATLSLSAKPTTKGCATPPTAEWSTSNTTIASVSNAGLVTGVGEGTATITATIGGVSGTASVTVTVRPVSVVSVTIAGPVVLGATVSSTVVTRAADNSVLSGRTITYTSATTTVATVNATTGVITPVALGTSVITATAEGVSGSATVTVIPTLEVNRFAYVWNDDENAPLNVDRTPNGLYSTNVAGGTILVARTGVGTYDVKLGKLAKTNNYYPDVVSVSSEGPTPVICRVVAWANLNAVDAVVQVACANMAGTPTNNSFDLLFVGSKSLPAANAFFLNPTGTASSTGNALYSYSSTTTNPSQTRLGAGQYQFDMGTGAIGRSTVLVSPYGGTRACSLQSWNTMTSAVLVNCITPMSITTGDNQASVLLATQGRAGKRWGFVQIENESAALNTVQTPNTATQNQSNGLVTTYSRTGAGSYMIRFPGLAVKPEKENLFVTAIGANHCQQITFVNDGADIVALVQCFSLATGLPANAGLTVFLVE